MALVLNSSSITGLSSSGGFSSRQIGEVLQVVSATYTTSTSTSSTSYIDTGLTATITPSSTTSKILIFINHTENYKTAGNVNNNLQINLVKNGTEITQFNNSLGYTGTTMDLVFSASYSYLDSPATSSSITYKIQACARTDGQGGTMYINRSNTDRDTVSYDARGVSSIVVMEIAA